MIGSKRAIDFTGKVHRRAPTKDNGASNESNETGSTSETSRSITDDSSAHHQQTEDEELLLAIKQMRDKENKSAFSEDEDSTVTTITSLDEYEGRSIEEKVDSLVEAHQILVFGKSWCLFKADAQDFLTQQLKVSIHSVEVDVLPHGDEISGYIQEVNQYFSLPMIYIEGHFVGGFEEVNTMYADGTLQQDYLQGSSEKYNDGTIASANAREHTSQKPVKKVGIVRSVRSFPRRCLASAVHRVTKTRASGNIQTKSC